MSFSLTVFSSSLFFFFLFWFFPFFDLMHAIIITVLLFHDVLWCSKFFSQPLKDRQSTKQLLWMQKMLTLFAQLKYAFIGNVFAFRFVSINNYWADNGYDIDLDQDETRLHDNARRCTDHCQSIVCWRHRRGRRKKKYGIRKDRATDSNHHNLTYIAFE